MTLLQFFLIVVLAVVVGGMVLKFWRYIVGTIVMLIAIIISVIGVILAILLSPIDIILKFCGYYDEERLQVKIVKQYDSIFYSNTSKRMLGKRLKRLSILQKRLHQVQEKKKDKEIKKILKKCKWIL